MALRVIDIVVPKSQVDAVLTLATEQAVIDAWQMPIVSDTHTLLRLLVPTPQTETLIDLLNGMSASASGFRIVVISAEAVLPQPRTPPANEQTSGAANGQTQELPQHTRISRDELYQDVVEGTRLSVVYGVSVILATVVAAIGLIRDDVAIIIGAMVIAPLLGPNVAFALATTLGDRELALNAGRTLGAGFLISVVLALGIGVFVPVDPTTPAIAARTTVAVDHLILALAAGSAGTLAVTTGVPAALIGVMVAVALLPPLVTAGLLVGAGYPFPALQALLLFAANVICVNLAGVVTFRMQGIRPRSWLEAEKARTASHFALFLWIILFGGLCVILLWSRLV